MFVDVVRANTALALCITHGRWKRGAVERAHKRAAWGTMSMRCVLPGTHATATKDAGAPARDTASSGVRVRAQRSVNRYS